MSKASFEIIAGAAVVVTAAKLFILHRPFDVNDSLMHFWGAIAVGYIAVGLAFLFTWGKASWAVATSCAVVAILLAGALGIWGPPFDLGLWISSYPCC